MGLVSVIIWACHTLKAQIDPKSKFQLRLSKLNRTVLLISSLCSEPAILLKAPPPLLHCIASSLLRCSSIITEAGSVYFRVSRVESETLVSVTNEEEEEEDERMELRRHGSETNLCHSLLRRKLHQSPGAQSHCRVRNSFFLAIVLLGFIRKLVGFCSLSPGSSALMWFMREMYTIDSPVDLPAFDLDLISC